MDSWQKFGQSLNSAIHVLKRRSRAEAAFAVAGLCFWVGSRLSGQLIPEFREGHQLMSTLQVAVYAVGAIALGYGTIRAWRLVNAAELPPAKDRPFAIKGPMAFTEADGELFRKLGRENELQKLLGLVLDDQVSMVVVRGASGVGKTSLLRAGLKHILSDRVSFHYWEAVPTEPDKGLLRAIQETWLESKVKPAGLDELVNPVDALGQRSHVVVLDQFEQLRSSRKIFQLLRRIIREAKPPHRITWVISFRHEFSGDWMDFISPEYERGFRPPPDISLQLFTAEQAREVIGQLIDESNLKDSIQQSVINNLVEAATVDGEVSPVDIGIGLLVLTELHERQGGKTITVRDYWFAGGAEGLLTQYISRCLEPFPKESQEAVLKAMLALRDPKENWQRLATGLTIDKLAAEAGTDERLLKVQLNRLADRDVRLLEAYTIDGSATRYRLPHERLIPALYRLKGKLLAEVDQARLRFQNAFQAWQINDKRSRYLLKGKALRLVERYKTQIPWGPDEQQKKNFLLRSKRHRRGVRGAFVVAGLALIGIGWFSTLKYEQFENRRYLSESGYPPELYDFQYQLKKLDLIEPLDIERFTWLSSGSIEELSVKAAGSSNSLAGLTSLSECRSLKKLTLDLSSNPLRDFRSQVSDLTSLAKLRGLQQLTLDLQDSQVRDLMPLAQLQGLQQLTLYLQSSQVHDLTPLAQLQGLQQLTLYVRGFRDSQVRDLKPLAQLKALQQLTLSLNESQVRDLTPLAQLHGLQQLTLDLGGSQVRDLTPLAQLQELQQLTLDLGGSQVRDLTPLAQLQELQQLTLELPGFPYKQVRDLMPLAQLQQLRQLTLFLSFSDLTDLMPLAQLQGLEQLSLYLGGAKMSNLKSLAQLQGLQRLTLYLGGSQVRDLTWLTQLHRLQQLSLDVGGSQVNDLQLLAQLPGLKQLTLGLGGSEVSDLTPLVQLQELQQLTLNLRNSKVSDLTPLGQLKRVSQLTLDISYHPVSDLKPLEQLQGLSQLTVDLGGSQLRDLTPLAQLQRLSQLTLKLGNSQLRDLTPLTQLHGLSQLTLDLGFSQLRDLTPLAQLHGPTQLTLDLRGSKVSDLTPLTKLQGLHQLSLYLRDGQVNDLKPVQELNSLQRLTIEDATRTQRMSLSKLPASMVELQF